MSYSLRVKWSQYFEIHISTPSSKHSYIPQTLSKASHLERKEQIRGEYSPGKTENPEPPSMSHLKPGRLRHSSTGPLKNQNKHKVGVSVALAMGYL